MIINNIAIKLLIRYGAASCRVGHSLPTDAAERESLLSKLRDALWNISNSRIRYEPEAV